MSVMCFSLSPLISGTVRCYWALPIHLLLCCVILDMGGGIKLTKGAAQELWCEWTIVCPMNLHILWYFINFKLTAKLDNSILNLNMAYKLENNIISKTNAQFWLFIVVWKDVIIWGSLERVLKLCSDFCNLYVRLKLLKNQKCLFVFAFKRSFTCSLLSNPGSCFYC